MTKDVAANRLKGKTKVGYSMGHVLNDMSASLQTSYMMMFHQSVLGLEKSNVGVVYLIGQILDAFTTIVVGYLSDLTINFLPFNIYGKRKVSFHSKVNVILNDVANVTYLSVSINKFILLGMASFRKHVSPSIISFSLLTTIWVHSRRSSN